MPVLVFAFLTMLLASAASAQQAHVPLPEHPRPDLKRHQWLNLNGDWEFRFDADDVGVSEAWFDAAAFDARIVVPFSWAAPLSGQSDEADIGWYGREIRVPDDWDGRRTFLVIGAADWVTTVWLDGRELGTHKGGYTPFSFELTDDVRPGAAHRLVIRVDDTHAPEMLEGKQGYGAIRGIWQTVFLESRGGVPLQNVHFTPDVLNDRVTMRARLKEPAPGGLTLSVRVDGRDFETLIAAGADDVTLEIPMPDARLWTLRDPYLYQATVEVVGGGVSADRVETYFGMRDISVVDLPGTDYRYVALNGEPVYLQLALDQGYHPDGYYTFPTDEFVRDEFLRARQIGLNGLRIHVKIDTPRKLFWADRMGMLVMADVPNSWGEPTEAMRAEVEHALRGMIARDYNHPSIFAWVPFNETWGLHTRSGDRHVYERETQEWVASIYDLAKSLDPTRLVEDNSVCCGQGHTRTDLNSFHDYLPGWAWDDRLAEVSTNTYPGSTWNFEEGFAASDQPTINSEFGNVWGYEGSTGDVDWSWDYHRAIDAFRRNPRIAGWLYTEHHDVINEWNGYWRYDRSEKFTGLEELVPGMSLRDLHAPLYVALGGDLSETVRAGATVQVPLFASFLDGSAAYGDSLVLESVLYGWNDLGVRWEHPVQARSVPYRAWMTSELTPLEVKMPGEKAVAVLAVRLRDQLGSLLSSNFKTFVVDGDSRDRRIVNGRAAYVQEVAASDFTEAAWSELQWDVLDGLKVNGAGSGHFEYRIPWPEGISEEEIQAVRFLAELGAKKCFDKDCGSEAQLDDDYMLGRGTHSPSLNPNAYPMTDETPYPSAVRVHVNGITSDVVELPDDPADHRGILSWHAQLRDRRLREAGSYGYLVDVALPPEAVALAREEGAFVVRLEVDEALPGGLAVYGDRFGRYPLNPSLLYLLRE